MKKIISLVMALTCLVLTMFAMQIYVGAVSHENIHTKMIETLYNGSGGKMTCDFDGYKSTPGHHEGIDFQATDGVGASIYSLIDGEVIRVDNSEKLSTLAIYDTINNKSVIYLHGTYSVSVGDIIRQGQAVGTESDKGANAAHTHIEVRDGKKQSAAKSVNDPILDNPNPYSYWNLIFSNNESWKDQYNPNRNSAITPELIETFLSAYPNGSLTKTATVNGQTVIHTLDTNYDLGFDNYYNYSNNLTQATPLSDKSTAQLLTPAEILYYACVENDMNVVWMLANIQKEQSLVSETHNAEPTYDVRLAHAVGYKKNWSEGEKNCGYIGQIISATYQFKLFANDGKNMEEAYNSYTDPNDTSNMRFDKFKPDIYDVYAAKFDALLGTTPPVVEEEYLAYPTITAPAADGTYTAGSAITFSWNAVEGATSYEYGIRDLTDDVTLNGADNTTTQTSVTLDGSLVKAGHEIKFAVGALGDEDMTSPGWSSVTVTIADSGDTPTPGTIIAEGTCGDNLTWTLDDAGTLTISGEERMYDYYDPAPWDAYKDTITSLLLPNGLTYIGYDAFRGCTGLTAVSIPDSVIGIQSGAFMGCSSLTTISMPDSVIGIGNCTFLGCSSLTAISIPDGVTSIGEGTFEDCSKLTSVSIPDSVTHIYNCAFQNCTSLTTISIPDSVTYIASAAFMGCSSLTTITIPNGVTSIESYTFYGCSSLVSVSIPDSVSSIGEGAFYSCSSLASISIPDSVTSIEYRAFLGCSSLTAISIPDGVTSIENMTFFGCTSLTAISIPDSVTSIGDDAFYECSSLISVSIPDGVTSIGEGAFYSCSSLASISIPDSVSSIEMCTFYKCTSLTSVFIPNSVTSIGEDAFSNCSSLASVSIPDSVSSIGEGVFRSCSSLASISIPYSITNIEKSAFAYCYSLASVSIPDSVSSIGEGAFYRCSSLTSVSIPNSVTSIGEHAFYRCSSLTSVSIPDGISSIERYTFYNCTSLTTVSIPNSVTNIEYAAFYKCSSLTAVAIPNSVTSIGEYAFSDCSSLTAISIPDSITSIERDSFSGCTGLITVSIPNSVTRIGDYAFNNCTSLPAISIPDSVTSIGVQAFRTCLSLTAITIPDSVTSIGDYIFYSCPNLTTVSIPAGITSINGAFYNCTSLTSVYFHGDAPTLNTNAFLNTPSSLVLYYIAGKSGWTSPTWTDSNGVTYNTATFTPGAVDPKPTIPGDISGDGVLDYFDVTALYAAYQSGEVDTEVMDVNHDGIVDYYDVSKLYAAFRGTATLT